MSTSSWHRSDILIGYAHLSQLAELRPSDIVARF